MKLQPKILSLVFSLAVLSAGLVVWMAKRSVDIILTRQVIQMGLAEATQLADVMENDFQNQSEISMLIKLQSSQSTTHADHVMVLNQSGMVLAHTDVSERGRIYKDPAILKMLAARSPETQVQKRGSDSIIEFSAPIWKTKGQNSGEDFLLGSDVKQEGNRIGTILLGLTLKNTFNTESKIVGELSIIMTLIGILVIGISIFLINSILRPIRSLAQGTAEISKGNYGAQITVFSKDELGSLAVDFNRMSKVLAETTVSKDFLGGILANMLDPLFVIGTNGNLRMVNQAALNLLGYNEDELIEKSSQILFSPLGNPLVTEGDTKNRELNLLNKKGEEVPVLYSISLLKNTEGKTAGFIIVARDMTERKRLETVIRRSEKMSAVGQLAAGVAHEINNPLGIIMGYAQAIVRRLAPGDPLETPLKSIEKEAVRCKNLVQDLLTFSRVSKVEREPMDLNKSVIAALSLITAQAKMKQVAVQEDLAPNLPRILCNPNQIQQVVINLATNGIDAMENSGNLSVKTNLLLDGPLSWVCLHIVDTGSGIPPELVTKIFEPFFTTKPVGKGTGLGLSLVHEIIKKHSGVIDVESRPGYTEFCIKFPVRTPEMAAAV